MSGKTLAAAAAAAGMSERTARQWQSGALPSTAKGPRTWRTREDRFLVFPVYFIGRWIRISNAVSDHAERVAEFGSIFPRVLQDSLVSTLFPLACAAAAAAVGAVGLIRLTGLRRWLCVAAVGGGGLLSLCFVWTLL